MPTPPPDHAEAVAPRSSPGGIVGDRGGFPVVISPLKKQAFSLLDGRCLDAEGVSIPVYDTRITLDGTVFVANSPEIRFGYRPRPVAG